MPLPPPPAAALMITGNPMSRANFSASSGSSTPPGVPGMMGTPTSCIVLRAAALSPMTRICPAVGPIKLIFEATHVSANSAFSARKPYPRCIARRANPLRAQRELGRIGRREQSIVVSDDALLVPVHQRLIEALHAVGHRAVSDQLADVERAGHIAHLIAHGLGVHQNFGGGHAALLVGAPHQSQRDDRTQRRR